MSIRTNLYETSGKIPAYDFFLKITKPEIAEKIEKLKLHSDGVFKRKFWEDLELSKNRFPNLRKLSIQNVKFNLFNLKYFENTQIESFNFRNTSINKLEYIERLLCENKRVMINHDTALMAIAHAKSTQDYGFMTLAIQTGSLRRKNSERIAKELLHLSTGIGHMVPMQKWAESIILPENTPDVIKKAISTIKHPLVIVKTIENECGIEMLVVYADIVSNPVFKRIFDSHFNEKQENYIQLQMSQDCLENMTHFELKGQLVPGISLDTLIELANLAEMYFWDSLKDSLRKYKVNCHEIWKDGKCEDPFEKFNSVLTELMPHFPDFLKPSILRQVVRFLELDHIEVFKEGCQVEFDETFLPVLNKLQYVHLILDWSDLDLLQENGPYHSVVSLQIVPSLIEDFVALISPYRQEDLSTEKLKRLTGLFPSCIEFNYCL